VIFVDTNVFMYAVGRAHPLREDARRFFLETASGGGTPLCTSAEVVQELLHAYLPVGREEALDAALTLVEGRVDAVFPVELEDVLLARAMASGRNGLGARDLLHLAVCHRRGIERLKSFDRALTAAFG
jgi:predicted nucleic acid-binding protein